MSKRQGALRQAQGDEYGHVILSPANVILSPANVILSPANVILSPANVILSLSKDAGRSTEGAAVLLIP